MAGRQAGRQAESQGSRLADKIQVGFKIFKIIYRLNYSGIYFVYYYCNLTTVLELHFNQLLSNKAYFKVCFEMQKFSAIVSRHSLLIGTNVPNDRLCNINLWLS